MILRFTCHGCMRAGHTGTSKTSRLSQVPLPASKCLEEKCLKKKEFEIPRLAQGRATLHEGAWLKLVTKTKSASVTQLYSLWALCMSYLLFCIWPVLAE